MPKPGVASARVIATVKTLRRRAGWRADDLADGMAEAGVPWSPSTVNNVENGRREALTVEERLALAIALNTSPADLLDPGGFGRVEILPGRLIPSAALRAWLAGQAPAPGQDPAAFLTAATVEVRRRTLGRQYPAAQYAEGLADLIADAAGAEAAGEQVSVETRARLLNLAELVSKSVDMFAAGRPPAGGSVDG